MIGQFLTWWLASSLLGLIAWPIVWRVFNRLSDRGYGLSRTLGILAAGYLLWGGCSLGILRNTSGGIIAAILSITALALLCARGNWRSMFDWVRNKQRMILVVEGLFLIAFALWSFVRANNPEIVATEKPMELGFLNAILRSKTFPPQDPWLSGYAISYYYFGYVLMAMLTRITGVSSGVAFNLGNALSFALTAVGSYSIIYNLLPREQGKPKLLKPLLGPVFVLITGNLEGFLDVLYHRHFFWKNLPDGQWVSRFWSWLNIKQLVNPPSTAAAWMPDRYLWWWRASRVVNDINLAGNEVEVIDEFPFFSFLLADNHPHVLALPFVLLAVACALQIYKHASSESFRLGRVSISKLTLKHIATVAGVILACIAGAGWIGQVADGLGATAASYAAIKTFIIGGLAITLLGSFVLFILGFFPSVLSKTEFWLCAWMFGSLAFLNAWDFPIYISILVVVLVWTKRHCGLEEILRDVLPTTIAICIGAVLLYLPWYPSFSSQAGGILPNLIYPTRLPHFLIMFGPLIVPILIWLTWKVIQRYKRGEWKGFLAVSIGTPLGLWAISLLLSFLVYRHLQKEPSELEAALGALGQTDLNLLTKSIFHLRLTNPWTSLLLGAALGMCWVLLRRHWPKPGEPKAVVNGDQKPYLFVVLLIGIGSLLILGPEYLYLRDLFGNRMNTVFKFYYAAWILWGLAAAYAVGDLLNGTIKKRVIAISFAVLPLALGLIYPILATWTKTSGFNPPAGRTLDGTAYLMRGNPGEYEAMQWMNANLEPGVIAEAIGGSYSLYARVSAHTGFPAVLGWTFHEFQWRGTTDPQGSREADIRRLYETRDWIDGQAIINNYKIRYIYIGPMEWSTYQVFDPKFEALMDLVYQNQDVMIYEVPSKEIGQ